MSGLFAKGYALIIGVGGDLPNTVDDAKGLANILEDDGRCAYPSQNITLLTGENATRENMISALDSLANKADDEATVIVYFSGHGYRVQSNLGPITFLIPFDYNVNNLFDTAVSGRELAQKLNLIRAKKLLLLLDCCHAGGLDQAKAPDLDMAKTPLPVEAEAILGRGNGRVLIASSKEDELSFAGKPYSAFTHALLEAFCGLGASKLDGYVRVADLALHTREMVPKRTHDRQHPILNFEQADNFVLAFYAGGEDKPKEVPFPNPEIEAQPGENNAAVFNIISGDQNVVAQGEGATAVGERGIYAKGDIGLAFTGDNNQVIIITQDTAGAFWQQFTSLSQDDLQEITAQYLKLLVDRYRYLDFKGMGISTRSPLRLPLQQLYVPLKARTELPEGDTWNRPNIEEFTMVPGEKVHLLSLLDDHDGLVVLGDPGAGKTTFLKYLALNLALGQSQDTHLGNRLPLVLSISAYAEALNRRGDIALHDYLAEFYKGFGLDKRIEAMVNNALSEGGALLLLDGLDEVADVNLRQRLSQQMLSFYNIYRRKGNKFIFTSRIVGYRETRLLADDMVECTLADFTEAEIELFVAKWTKALEFVLQGESDTAVFEAHQENEELLAAIRRNPGIRQLSANPLLLTILALMKRQGVLLPERRVELYENYIRTLLTHWNLARGLHRSSARHLDMFDVMHVLAPLALWMQEFSGSGQIQEQALRQKLIDIYSHRGQQSPEESARQFLADIHDYAGLLVEQGPGMYGFLHLTFQEYLTAVAIVQTGQSDIDPILAALRQHLEDSNWHEVILLAIGYLALQQGRDKAATDLVLALLTDDADPETVVLMGEAALSIWPSGLTPKGYTAVVNRLHQTFLDTKNSPVLTRVKAGQLLSSLGDLRQEVLNIDEMSFCFVAAGPFWLGEGEEITEYTGLATDYWIGQFPVTNAQFNAFVANEGYETAEFWQEATAVERWQNGKTKDWELNEWRSQPQNFGFPFDLANHPVVGITWYEALAFSRWLTKRWQRSGLLPPDWQVRLPSEVEWEKAARGGIQIPTEPLIAPVSLTLVEPTVTMQENENPQRPFPWGSELTTNRANYRRTDVETTNAVGCFAASASPYGCEELCGNVWEWMRNRHEPYPYDPTDGRESPDMKLYESVALRGGAYWNKAYVLGCSERARRSPNDQSGSYGFRVVISKI